MNGKREALLSEIEEILRRADERELEMVWWMLQSIRHRAAS